MKLFLTAAAIACATISLAQAPQHTKLVEADKLYDARLTTKFSLGAPQFTTIVVNLWKGWDENRLDMLSDFLADDASFVFADGTVITGKKAVTEGAKQYRNMFKHTKSTIDTYTSLKMEDGSNTTGVLIWGQENSEMHDGTRNNQLIHEVWLFNKDGKVTYMHQYTSKPPKKD